jgi:hypothetical protein
VDYIRTCTKLTLKCIFGPFTSDIYPLEKNLCSCWREHLSLSPSPTLFSDVNGWGKEAASSNHHQNTGTGRMGKGTNILLGVKNACWVGIVDVG